MAGAHLPLAFDADLVDGLRRLAATEHVTLQMVLLAAWAAQLWRISGERDVCVGTPVAGRRPADESVIGNYVTTILVRVTVEPEQPLRTLLATVRESALTAHAHRDLPFDRVVRLARLDDASPLAAAVLNFQSGFTPLSRLAGHGPAQALDVDPDGGKFPLNLAVLEYGREFQARLKYATDLFREDTVRAWLDEYAELLRRFVEAGSGASLLDLVGARRGEEPAVPRFNF
jgi:non-ribosomal peptide synthetase component F